MNLTPKIPRDSLRKMVMQRRISVEKKIHDQTFQTILSKFLSLEIYKDSKKIMAYFGKVSNGEFDTTPLLEYIIQDKKDLYLPRCSIGKINTLDLYKIVNIYEDLELGHFGIMEPKINKYNLEYIENIDIIIMPGLLFDKFGMRLGYGGGFFDRLLEERQNRKPTKIALCNEFCVVDFKLEKKPHDILVDILITEKNCYKFSK